MAFALRRLRCALTGDVVKLGSSFFPGDTRLQPANGQEVMRIARPLCCERTGRPDFTRLPVVDRSRILKLSRQNADDSVVHSVERDVASYNAGIAAKPALPQLITQHRDARVCLVFFCREGSSKQRCATKCLKQIRGRALSFQPYRFIAARQVEVCAFSGGDLCERLATFDIGGIVIRREFHLINLLQLLPDDDKLTRILIREPFEDDCIYYAEDC